MLLDDIAYELYVKDCTSDGTARHNYKYCTIKGDFIKHHKDDPNWFTKVYYNEAAIRIRKIKLEKINGIGMQEIF